MEFAVKHGYCESDPTAGIKVSVQTTDGHTTWEEEHIAQFRACWAIGTMERLAMELALNTGQRVSDLVRMGRQHIRNGVLKIKQKKRTKAGQADVEIPVLPELAAVLAATASENLTFLINGWDKPFTDTGFSEWFSKAARAAGLPKGYTAHGVRKGCCKRLADQGCDVKEIAAITGHKTLKRSSITRQPTIVVRRPRRRFHVWQRWCHRWLEQSRCGSLDCSQAPSSVALQAHISARPTMPPSFGARSLACLPSHVSGSGWARRQKIQNEALSDEARISSRHAATLLGPSPFSRRFRWLYTRAWSH
jgi:hypothetical protein